MNKIRHNQLRYNPFTLIELLVILGVISILFSFLIPALVMARDASLSIMCKNNLEQSAFGISCYSIDNNGVAILYSRKNGVSGSTRSWMQHVTGFDGGEDYLLDKNTAVCPTMAPYEYTDDKYIYAGRITNSRNKTGAEFIPDVSYDRTGSTFVRIVNIQETSDYFFTFDSYDTRYEQQLYTVYHYDGSAGRPYIQTRHDERANISFADGHVENADPMRLRDLGFYGGYNQNAIAVPF